MGTLTAADVGELLKRYEGKERRALSRLVTLAAHGESTEAIQAAVAARVDSGRVVAITGSGGVGKSSLIGSLVTHLREIGRTVAVIACDPQSPLTGGALLGDRIRITKAAEDEGVFVRSLPALSGHQAIADHLPPVRDLLLGYGFDVVLIETVGAGQGDTAVYQFADVLVLVLQPETGDDLQWEKAGVLELADVVVVNKADLKGAESLANQLASQLNLPGYKPVSVVKTSTIKGDGVGELWSKIEELPIRRHERKNGESLLQLAQERLADRFRQQSGRVAPIVERWSAHDLGDTQAADELLRVLGNDTK